MLRVVATSLITVILLVAGSIIYYDQRDIRPYIPNIRAVLESSSQEDRNVPGNVENFIWKVEKRTNRNTDWLVVRNLVSERYGSMGAGIWHFRGFMWSLLLPLHFDKHTRTGLYCHYLVYENGQGFSNAANFYFHKSPHELGSKEIAAILVIGQSPSNNSPTRHPEHFEQAKARILTAFETTQ